MSTVVYQELKTCYESNNFIESRQLSLKLSAPKDNFSESVGAGLPKPPANSFVDVSSKPDNEAYIKCSYSNMFGWSGIEGISNAQRETVEKEQAVYVHPLVKRSSCMLSQKSLEMCTESLGCETGTCILDSSVFNQSAALASNEVRKPRPKVEARKEITQAKLPPPLTSISGPNSIHVKPIREHGRLVIKAVSTPATHSCLQAERSNGRLRLSLVQECSSDAELDCCSSDDEDNDDMYDCEIPDNNERECCTQNDSNDNNNDDEDPHQRSTQAVSIAKEEVEVKEKEEEVGLGENMKDVKLMLEVKVGEYVQIQRPSRCKERGQGNKRLVNWEPFWVAT